MEAEPIADELAFSESVDCDAVGCNEGAVAAEEAPIPGADEVGGVTTDSVVLNVGVAIDVIEPGLTELTATAVGELV